MAGTDSEALDVARTTLNKAVREFVRVSAEERGFDDAYVLGWAGYAEYTTTDFQREETSGNMVLVPDDQPASMSRGLLEFGADAFNRSV